MASQNEIAKLIIKLFVQTDKMNDDLNKAKGNIGSFASAVKKLFAGIGVVILTKKLSTMIAETAKMADEMIKTSQRIGVAVETLSSLKYAADLSGVAFGQLTTGLRLFASNMYDASQGIGEGKRAFDALGLTANKLSNPDGTLRNLKNVMFEVADEFANMEDGAKKTALAQDMFGRSGAAMIPLLNKGSKGIQDMAAEAEAFGVIIDTKTGQAAERFNDNLTRLTALSAGLKLSLLKELLPALENVTNAMVDQAKESGALKTSLVEGVGFGLKTVATAAIITFNHLNSVAEVMATILATMIKVRSTALITHTNLNSVAEVMATILATMIKVRNWDFAGAFKILSDGMEELKKAAKETGAFKILSDGMEELKKAAKETDELIESIWGEIDEANIRAINSTENLENKIDDLTEGAIEKLGSKIRELQRQYIGLVNPTQAARLALEEFVEQTTKGAKDTEVLQKNISELRQEFEKYAAAQREVNIKQAEMAEEMAATNRQVEISLAELEVKYKNGLIGATDYFATKRKLAEESALAEISALEAERNALADYTEKRGDFDLAKAYALDTQIRDKKAAFQKKNIELTQEESVATKELSNSLEKLLNRSETANESRYDKELNETAEHYDKMLKKVELFNDKKTILADEAYTKQELIDQLNRQKAIALDEIAVNQKLDIAQKEYTMKADLAGQIGNLASQAYALSAGKSEAFFYIQQAALVAEATMNTAAAATNAMKTAPGGAAGAGASIASIWALGMAQIGIILAQTIQGPKKMALGGLVTEGSGTKDDVLILAKKDEYIMPSETSRYYGLDIMNEIRNMSIPKNFMSSAGMGNISNISKGGDSMYSVNVPVSVENPALAMSLRAGIERTVIDIMREYAR